MHAGYMKKLFGGGYFDLINNISNQIKKNKWFTEDIGHIAFMGCSGVSVGFPVAELLGIEPVLCRKKTVNCHSGFTVEFAGNNVRKFIVIDDLVDTGHTVDMIVEQITKEIETYYTRQTTPPVCAAVFCYGRGSLSHSKYPTFYI